MKKSSATILESDLEPTIMALGSDFSTAAEPDAGSGSADPTTKVAEAFAPLRAPNFGELGSIYAITAKRAGRLNAKLISPQEREALLRERQELLDKQFSQTMTRRESNRLEYVRWSLDRIEDAEHGESLDALELAISHFEDIKESLSDLKEQLDESVESERTRQRQRNVRT
jgi:hypothetical protein